MRIGYLHVGALTEQESGVTRFGRLLAAAVGQLPGVEVQEAEVVFGEDEAQNLADLAAAGRSLRDCAVVHLQFNKHIWGCDWDQLKRLQTFQQYCTAPLITTLHDVYYGSYAADHPLKFIWRQNHRQRSFSKFRTLAVRSTYKAFWHEFWPNRKTMKWILSASAQVIACTKTEAKRIKHYAGADRIQTIPHYVEERHCALSHEVVKSKLGFTPEDRVIVLQGFIYDGKGHPLLVEALPHLPQTVKVVFAGGVAPKSERYMQGLEKRMEELKVSDRITITGYLPNQDLNEYLMAADLALCPFTSMAASGSVATWIALGRPILASKLPQIDEINALVPGAIDTFANISPDGLTIALLKWLVADAKTNTQVDKLRVLRERLSIARIAQEHMDLYRQISGRTITLGMSQAISLST
jgi:glycosyltransferase involved in cell wall biosynthesis